MRVRRFNGCRNIKTRYVGRNSSVDVGSCSHHSFRILLQIPDKRMVRFVAFIGANNRTRAGVRQAEQTSPLPWFRNWQWRPSTLVDIHIRPMHLPLSWQSISLVQAASSSLPFMDSEPNSSEGLGKSHGFENNLRRRQHRSAIS